MNRQPGKRVMYALNRKHRRDASEVLSWDEIGVILAHRGVCPLMTGTAVLKIHNHAMQKLFLGLKESLRDDAKASA